MEPTKGSVTAIMEVGRSRGLTFGDSLEVSAMSYIDNCRAHALIACEGLTARRTMR
jgi:hypothetical protein